jgi:hypothetical protein
MLILERSLKDKFSYPDKLIERLHGGEARQSKQSSKRNDSCRDRDRDRYRDGDEVGWGEGTHMKVT